MVKRKPPNVHQPSNFTEANLKALSKDLQSGRFATLTRQTVSDDMVTGLRAVVYKSGLISLAVSYHFGEARPFLNIGSLNKDADDHISIEDAREIAKTVKALADKGIDPQAGLHARLIKELKRDGTAWKPK